MCIYTNECNSTLVTIQIMSAAYLHGVIEIVDDANNPSGRRFAGRAGWRYLVADGRLAAETCDGWGTATLPTSETAAATWATSGYASRATGSATSSSTAHWTRRGVPLMALLTVARRLKRCEQWLFSLSILRCDKVFSCFYWLFNRNIFSWLVWIESLTIIDVYYLISTFFLGMKNCIEFINT